MGTLHLATSPSVLPSVDKIIQAMDESSGGGGDPDILSESSYKVIWYKRQDHCGQNWMIQTLGRGIHHRGTIIHQSHLWTRIWITLGKETKKTVVLNVVCKMHGTRGIKRTISRKVWRKKKSGLYGYSTTSMNVWTKRELRMFKMGVKIPDQRWLDHQHRSF